MNVVIANRQRMRKINSRLLKKIAAALLAGLKITEAELGISIVNTQEMTLLNETFLGHAGSTDVITFDYSEQETRGQLHGEIFICAEEAVSQSKHFKTTWQSEIVRYLIHGVLHLLGHDDRRVAARGRMKREENRRLSGLSKKFSLAQIGGIPKLRA